MDITEDIRKFVEYVVKNELTNIIVEEDIADFGKKVTFHNTRGKYLTIKINLDR